MYFNSFIHSSSRWNFAIKKRLVFDYFFIFLVYLWSNCFFSWLKSFLIKGKYMTFWSRIFILLFISFIVFKVKVLYYEVDDLSFCDKDLCLPSLCVFNLFIISSRLKYYTSKLVMSVYKLFKFYNKDFCFCNFEIFLFC